MKVPGIALELCVFNVTNVGKLKLFAIKCDWSLLSLK